MRFKLKTQKLSQSVNILRLSLPELNFRVRDRPDITSASRRREGF